MADPNDPIHTNAITWSPTDSDPRALMDLQRNIQHRNVQQHIDDPAYDRNLHPNNFEPYVHKELRSFSRDRYTKQIATTTIIDSRDRNVELYPFPNNFTINLGKQYEYVESITLTSMDIDNTTPPVHQYNNSLQWIYPRECDVPLDTGGPGAPGSVLTLIPGVPNTEIPSSMFATERIKYTAIIPTGFYSMPEFVAQLVSKSGNVMHSMADSGAVDLEGILHRFDFDVNVNTHQVATVNRVFLLEPVAVQTLVPTSGVQDVFSNYVVGPALVPDARAFFLTVPGDGTAWSTSLYPVVLNNIPAVGGFQPIQINWMSYWSADAWGTTSGPIAAGAPYYEVVGNIQIGTLLFTRFKFYPRLTQDGGSVNAPILGTNPMAIASHNIILSTTLTPYPNISAASAAAFVTPFTSPLGRELNLWAGGTPLAGLALPFGFITLPEPFATDCNLEAMKRPRELSVLSVFDFEQTERIIFSFIQTNQPIDKKGTGHSSPVSLIDWERNSVGDYLLNSSRYMLMRLVIPGRPEDESGGNTVKTTSKNITDSNNNIGFFEEPVRDFNSRSIDNIFAKIRLNTSQPNRSIEYQHSPLRCYDMPLSKLNEITVQLVNRQGMLVNVRNDWNFTIEIIELKDVLEETLIDTRNGSHVVTGRRGLNHHY